MRKDDPCIRVCQFDGRTGYCVGCGLTVPELRSWKKLTPYRRMELAREAQRRLPRLQNT